MRSLELLLLFVVHFLPLLVLGQLSGSVGPTTSTAAKKSVKQCNVLDYGAKADETTDLGPSLEEAWAACASGGLVLIPNGQYSMQTWATLSGGNGTALQLDGTINRHGTSGGTMIVIQHSKDIEFFSSNGKGVIQGNGYEIHETGSYSGPRLVRLADTSDFSMHDLALIDSPSFHIFMDSCSNGEVYNLIIRGGDHGGLDGIDIIGSNIHVHDVMVTNKDECVTVKSPSSHLLIEQIYCNWSGGSAIGSLSTNTAISHVIYQKIYTVNSNQMMMIKSNGGSGYVNDVQFTDFIGHTNAYSLDVDQTWAEQAVGPGPGVQLTNLTFTNWRGTCSNGSQRGPIKFNCAAQTPCTAMHVSDFAIWTDTGSSIIYACTNAFGDGACLRQSEDETDYSSRTSISSPPADYMAPSLPDDIRASLGTTVPIDIPAWPERFFPGTVPLKKLAAQ